MLCVSNLPQIRTLDLCFHEQFTSMKINIKKEQNSKREQTPKVGNFKEVSSLISKENIMFTRAGALLSHTYTFAGKGFRKIIYGK